LGIVHVRPHIRRDGTYVPAHVRSSPDRNALNNWSTIGNVNPFTGKPGRKNPLQIKVRRVRRVRR